ncbi:MAG: L-arabinonate dehydratase [Pseudomonadota bacterium]
MTKDPSTYRSARWFAHDTLRGMHHRSRIFQMGYDPEDWTGKPVIALINTWSDINQCHQHFKHRVEDVKRGVLQAGGFPIELPAISLSEPIVKPSTMLYRNLLAIETEELLRSHPIDGAVLMGGCDKTTPGLLMGAISMGIPAIFLPAGPMLRGNWRGEVLGSGSDVLKYWDERRAGEISKEQWFEMEAGIARSFGTCMTMGTASTMTSITEALGMTLPGATSIPAADSSHPRMSAASGRRIVEMVREDLTPDKILTEKSVANGVTVAMATGCSTNAIIHLIAMSRRAGINLTMDDLDKAGREVPVIANIRPSGETYLMEDFYYAGGLRGLMSRLTDRLHLDAMTVTGEPLSKALEGAEVFHDDVIRPIDNPIYPEGSLAVLRGNLAPNGCVVKPAAMEPRLQVHEGPALVFDTYPEMKAAADDPELKVTPDHVMIFRGAGPIGAPGMPEWGFLPIPVALLNQGYRDMIRISDCRMSGTAYGACVLHVAPEAAIGGPLAFARTGDRVRINVPEREISLVVSDAELQSRRAAWVPPEPKATRGYNWMFTRHVTQADQGCDFDYLQTDFGYSAAEPDIF